MHRHDAWDTLGQDAAPAGIGLPRSGRLRRGPWRSGRGVALLGLSLAAGLLGAKLLIGAKLPPQQAQPVPDQVPETIRTQRVEIVDASGRLCAVLASQDGSGSVVVCGPDQQPLVVLGGQRTASGWIGTVTTTGTGSATTVLGSANDASAPVRVVGQDDVHGAANVTATRARLDRLRLALEDFHRHFDKLPVRLDELLRASSRNLGDPYVKDESDLKDAWGNWFKFVPSADNTSFQLISLGADGAEGGEGSAADIVVLSPDK